MKNIKLMTLGLIAAVIVSIGAQANAAGVGFINYKKVQDSYDYAQTATKQIDAEALKLQQYLIDKEKQYKALDTPLKKQNFEEKTQKEFKAKEAAYMQMKLKKEEEIYNKIQSAAKQVLVDQKLDAVIDFRVIFVGGIDVTDLVIQKLKTAK